MANFAGTIATMGINRAGSIMSDIFFLVIGAAFIALCVFYTHACDRL
jgi:hypothetical protein